MNYLKTVLVATLLLQSLPARSAETKEILVVLSGEHTLLLKNGKTAETGFYLNELAVPLEELINAGYKPVITTPSGKRPSLDHDSDSNKYFHGDETAYQKAKKLIDGLILSKNSRIRALSDFTSKEIDHFSAVFVPGGHAPMIDLYNSVELGKVLRRFHELRRPTALICHGPVSLLSAQTDGSDWIYRGYHMTVFNDSEERKAEQKKLGGSLAFYPEDALRDAGAILESGVVGTSHVVEDRELLTGQNPASDEEFGNALLRKLTQSIESINPYHRLYQGYTTRPTSNKEFEIKMNGSFFPLFQKAKPEGLTAYRPLLPPKIEGCHLPDEIALLTFEDEFIYTIYKSSQIGKKIGAAHGAVFDPKESKSLVPEAFKSHFEVDRTFDLNPGFKDYIHAKSAVLIFCGLNQTITDTLNQLKPIYSGTQGVDEVLVTVSGDHLIEYVFNTTGNEDLEHYFSKRKETLKGIFKNAEFIPLKKHRIGKPCLSIGSGMDATL